MTDVTTAVTPTPVVQIFAVPGGTQPYSIVPRATVTFFSSSVVPAKLAADNNQSLFTLNLPQNFVYRLAECRAWANTTTSGQLNDWEDVQSCLLSGGIGGSLQFGLAAGNAYANTFVSVTNHTQKFFEPSMSLPDALVASTSSVTGKLEIRWLDVSSDSTAITNHFIWAKFLQYDVDQATKYPVHTPVPVIS